MRQLKYIVAAAIKYPPICQRYLSFHGDDVSTEVTLTKVLFPTFRFRSVGSVKYLCCSHIIASG